MLRALRSARQPTTEAALAASPAPQAQRPPVLGADVHSAIPQGPQGLEAEWKLGDVHRVLLSTHD